MLNELIDKYKKDIFIIKGTINELQKNKKSTKVRDEINMLLIKKLTLESVVEDIKRVVEDAKYINSFKEEN